MSPKNEEKRDESRNLKRRRLLSIAGGTAATVSGLGAVAGTAAAWERLEVDFKGCSEAWIVISEEELGRGLEVDVIVTDDGEAVCESVEMTEENATTIPGRYGDAPVIKYRAPKGEKLLGVVGNSRVGNPLDSDTEINDHRCTRTPNTPSVDDASCYEDRVMN